eukprot:214267_1
MDNYQQQTILIEKDEYKLKYNLGAVHETHHLQCQSMRIILYRNKKLSENRNTMNIFDDECTDEHIQHNWTQCFYRRIKKMNTKYIRRNKHDIGVETNNKEYKEYYEHIQWFHAMKAVSVRSIRKRWMFLRIGLVI